MPSAGRVHGGDARIGDQAAVVLDRRAAQHQVVHELLIAPTGRLGLVGGEVHVQHLGGGDLLAGCTRTSIAAISTGLQEGVPVHVGIGNVLAVVVEPFRLPDGVGREEHDRLRPLVARRVDRHQLGILDVRINGLVDLRLDSGELVHQKPETSLLIVEVHRLFPFLRPAFRASADDEGGFSPPRLSSAAP